MLVLNSLKYPGDCCYGTKYQTVKTIGDGANHLKSHFQTRIKPFQKYMHCISTINESCNIFAEINQTF